MASPDSVQNSRIMPRVNPICAKVTPMPSPGKIAHGSSMVAKIGNISKVNEDRQRSSRQTHAQQQPY